MSNIFYLADSHVIRNENILYLGGIVFDYWLNKEKLFDSGNDKEMTRWSL
jgi:hypothetical protein